MQEGTAGSGCQTVQKDICCERQQVPSVESVHFYPSLSRLQRTLRRFRLHAAVLDLPCMIKPRWCVPPAVHHQFGCRNNTELSISDFMLQRAMSLSSDTLRQDRGTGCMLHIAASDRYPASLHPNFSPSTVPRLFRASTVLLVGAAGQSWRAHRYRDYCTASDAHCVPSCSCDSTAADMRRTRSALVCATVHALARNSSRCVSRPESCVQCYICY
jgi:hypothetical protein